MCLFSGYVHSVAATKIFARVDGGTQWLAYQMSVRAKEPVAMILPMPVKRGLGEDALRFIDLSGYPLFFTHLDHAARMRSFGMSGAVRGAPLAVHDVGAFVASYVPTTADFARLDPRFRLPPVIADIGMYRDFGFAVFQLKDAQGPAHPMAFTFPTARPDRIFFPTVHVHDGGLPEFAKFDHCLYLQHPTDGQVMLNGGVGESSGLPARTDVDAAGTGGVVDGERIVQRIPLRGERENADIVLSLGDVWTGTGFPPTYMV